MATITDLRSWYESDLSRFAAWNHSVQIEPPTQDDPKNINRQRIRIYTETHCYSIVARDPGVQYRETDPPQMPDDRGFVEPQHTPRPALMDAGYLGCTVSNRKPRAGENWCRGSDLADGPLTRETWQRILADIVSYELVRVHRVEDVQKAAELLPLPSVLQ